MDYHGNLTVKNLKGSVTVNDRSRLAKGVTRHAKFILKSKNIFSKNPGLGCSKPDYVFGEVFCLYCLQFSFEL